MKKIVYSLLIVICLFIAVGCNSKKSETNYQNNSTNFQETNSNEVIKSVKAIINGKEYVINLEDNETANSFANLLPQELNMSELNGNEKYIYLDIQMK